MQSYDVKTYERFFWKLYKDAFKNAVKGFFKADNTIRGDYLYYYKYIHEYRFAYKDDSRKNPKWSDFMFDWTEKYAVGVWTTGLVFRRIDRTKAESCYEKYEEITSGEFMVSSVAKAYDTCDTDNARNALLAIARWMLNVPVDLYDELALP